MITCVPVYVAGVCVCLYMCMSYLCARLLYSQVYDCTLGMCCQIL